MTAGSEPLPEPARLVRRRADGQEGRVTRDRLTTMLVLAALLHGLIILGISFTSPGTNSNGMDRGLEVLLVSDELPTAERNDSATYLAQRTQIGAGNTKERLPARLPEEGGAPTPAGSRSQAASGASSDPVLATTGFTTTRLQMQPLPPELAQPTQGELEQERQELLRAGDQELRLPGATRDEYYLSADTRESPFAPYLDGWRRRVERIGTVNYPNSVRREGLAGSPVIEVVIERDGRLRSARIQRSSGHPEIDAAALDILRLANPFDPFPPELARDYRSMRFAYEWQFEGGQPGQSAVSVP